MSHYEKLGVTETADANEIKRAYRAKAKDLHPDKGGDTKEFADVARAYEVLKDPERRLLYDTTGADSRPPIAKEVDDVLMGLFNAALANEGDVEVIDFARGNVQTKLEQMPKDRASLDKRKKKLESRRKKVKAKGVNLVHRIIDMELKGIEANLANIDHAEKVGKACLLALEAYEEEMTPQLMTPNIIWSMDNVTFG